MVARVICACSIRQSQEVECVSEAQSKRGGDADVRCGNSKVTSNVFLQIECAIEPMECNVTALDANTQSPEDLCAEHPVEQEPNDVGHMTSCVVEALPGHGDDERFDALIEKVDGAAPRRKVGLVQKMGRVLVDVEVELEFTRAMPRYEQSPSLLATLQVLPSNVQPLNAR